MILTTLNRFMNKTNKIYLKKNHEINNLVYKLQLHLSIKLKSFFESYCGFING